MPLAPPPEPTEPTPAQVGVAVAATAYQTALMMREHWLAAYGSWFARKGWTVADLQAMTDGIDADSIARTGSRNAYEMLVAHRYLQTALRTALPAAVMANDPTTAAVPFVTETTPEGERIVWDASAKYPTAAGA